MNYEPNTEQWQRGALVLHDADAKEPKMIMHVLGYARDGQCKTQYLNLGRRRTIWHNDLKYLHAIGRFLPWASGLGPSNTMLVSDYAQDEFELVRRFNRKFPIGTPVRTTSADGGFTTTTTTEAYMDKTCSGVIHLAQGGYWLLRFISATEKD